MSSSGSRLWGALGWRARAAWLHSALAGLWWAKGDAEVDAELTQHKFLTKLGLTLLLFLQTRKTSNLYFLYGLITFFI